MRARGWHFGSLMRLLLSGPQRTDPEGRQEVVLHLVRPRVVGGLEAQGLEGRQRRGDVRDLGRAKKAYRMKKPGSPKDERRRISRMLD